MRPDDGLMAWGMLELARGAIYTTLSRMLEEECDLSLSEQELLYRLVEAPQHRLRMVELASKLSMGKSGITRLVDRLVQRGFVTREQPADNRRTIYATLTVEGMQAFHRARPVFLKGVERCFSGQLSPEDVADLQRVLGKILEGPAADEGRTETTTPVFD